MKQTIFVVIITILCVKGVSGQCPSPLPSGMVYCNDFDAGATSTPQRLVDLQPNAWAGGCNNPEPNPCPTQLNGYGPAYVVYYDAIHRGVMYESLCTRRTSCGTANFAHQGYVWATRVNNAYSKNAFFKLEQPQYVGKVHDGIDYCATLSNGGCNAFSGHADTHMVGAGINTGFGGFGTFSCNFGSPIDTPSYNCAVKDLSCTSFQTCIGANWFWLGFYYEVVSINNLLNIRNITGTIRRCNDVGDVCEKDPLLTLTLKNPITDQAYINNLLNGNAGDNIYPDDGGFLSGLRVTLEDYVETLETPVILGRSAPTSPHLTIRGPGYVAFR
ncbi:MAG: hypothetical protein HYR55_02725 [Acidobacteria bacterium]|nr:hypothetical protein [Acidobacteriota bacterium]MBI3654953.1 hypothetical protein [Acidobacteriota bacterium]